MKRWLLPISTAIAVSSLLTVIQIVPRKTILLLERAFSGGGWLQIALITGYAFLVAWNMQDPAKSALWRKRIWVLLSVVFFGQLALGLLVSPFFLMTGKLHLPIPAMILAGPLYRGEVGMMPMLFLSTILISGPAWCSQICYFGGLDNLSASSAPRKTSVQTSTALKLSLLLVFASASLLLRYAHVPTSWAITLAIAFGVGGGMVILFSSRMRGKMVHCMIYCPIGTVVQYLKIISPFRLKIDASCSACNRCTVHCNYGALEREHILHHRPGPTCTLCGDCLSKCSRNSLQYRFLRLEPEVARMLWLFLSITLHAVTLAIARI